MDISSGEAIGLFCAFVWALNAVITRTQSHKVPPALMNAIRCATAGLFFWIALTLTSSLAVYGLLSGKEWGLLIGSVIIGVTMGDTLYLWVFDSVDGVQEPSSERKGGRYRISRHQSANEGYVVRFGRLI